KKDDPGAKESQLFADNGKYHIILGLRHESQLLYAFSQSSAEQSPGTDGIKPLKRLVAFLIVFRISPDSDPLQAIALKGQKNSHKSHSQQSHDHKLSILGAGHKYQHDRNPQNDDRSTQVACAYQAHDGKDHGHNLEKGPHFSHFLDIFRDHMGEKEDHCHF